MGIQEDAGVSAAPGSQHHLLRAIKILINKRMDDYFDLQTSAENILARESATEIKLIGPTRLLLDTSGLVSAHTIPAQGKILGESDLDTATGGSGSFEAATDYYVYLCVAGRWKISKNSTAPKGYTSQTARKIGGFHTLCANVGPMPAQTPEHPLTNAPAGTILPQSVWSINFRPASSPEGMVFDPNTKLWFDIYLGVFEDGALKSKYANVAMSGDKGTGSQTAFHWFRFVEEYHKVNKRLPFQHEFMSAARGAPEGCAWWFENHSSGGGSVRIKIAAVMNYRSVSNIGCENITGIAAQFGLGNLGNDSGVMVNAFDSYVGGDNGTNKGRMFDSIRVFVFGGHYSNTSYDGGSRCIGRVGALEYNEKFKGRGVAAHKGN